MVACVYGYPYLHTLRYTYAIYLQEKIDSYLYKYCRDLDSAFSQTLFCGCLAGLVIGCILDFFHFMKSQKRLNDLLREIEEVRGAK